MSDIKQVKYDIERCICHVPDACRDCSHYTGTVGFGCMENLMSDAFDLLKEQEEIIRCKDCYYYHKPEYGFTIGDCTYRTAWYPVKENEFCSLAKRKEVVMKWE